MKIAYTDGGEYLNRPEVKSALQAILMVMDAECQKLGQIQNLSREKVASTLIGVVCNVIPFDKEEFQVLLQNIIQDKGTLEMSDGTKHTPEIHADLMSKQFKVSDN